MPQKRGISNWLAKFCENGSDTQDSANIQSQHCVRDRWLQMDASAA
mgnify:CR=1 FL=1